MRHDFDCGTVTFLLFILAESPLAIESKNSLKPMILCHSIPGRLRLKSDTMRGSYQLSEQLENRLRKIEGIISAETRVTTGSVILVYDVDIVTPETLRELASQYLKKVAKAFHSSSKSVVRMKKNPASPIRSGWSLRYLLINSFCVSCFLGYALIRKYLLKAPLPQRVFGLTGLVTDLGGIPLLSGMINELRGVKRPGLMSFLGIGCFSAVLAGELFTALEIVWLLSFGLFLEEYVKKQAHRAIQDILQVAPRKTVVLIDGAEKEINISDLKEKAITVVRTDQRIPADGTVFKGKALIDEAHITGRAFAELRRKNDVVYAGTRVQEGTVYIRAQKVGADTYLAQLLRLVEASLAEQTQSQRKADVLADRLTTFGWASTLATLVITGNLSRAISVMLVMSCPCATVLAASTAVSAGIANAARRNILIKGGTYLEKFKDIETVCFDKTGTLTLNTPQVVDIVPRNSRIKPDAVLALAASAEAESNHPVAQAILKESRTRKISFERPKSTKAFLGRGIQARTASGIIRVGNRQYFKSAGIKTAQFSKTVTKQTDSGQTAVFVARNKTLAGMILLTHTIRAETSSVLKWLHKNGIQKIVLISGDLKTAVKAIAKHYLIDEFQGELLPEEKARFIDALEAKGHGVIMVGDGINDALALSKASVGVAMGAGGSEVAIETADIALADSDLRGLVALRQLSEQTHRIVEMNFWLATASNIAGVILGFAGKFSPVMAGIFHVGHTVGIMANSARLINWQDADSK
jgi:cation-transporting P-type ATPase C